PPFPENAVLYGHIRQAPVVKREVPVATGEIDPAFATAARIVEAEYEWPFQSHASMGRPAPLPMRGPKGQPCGTARRSRTSRSTVSRAGPAAGQGARDLVPSPGLLWTQRRRRYPRVPGRST